MTLERRQWYETMLRIRLFEERAQALFMSGAVQGTTHLCDGQEAVSTGVVAALEANDVLTNTYRGHGEAIARGMPLEAAFGELMGRATGCCGGVGGSMHLADFVRGNIGANAIVGGGLPIAVGAALAFQIRGEARVAVAFCGDGATNIGTFHEALNMAALWRAPVVFVIVNNLYGEYSPVRATTPIDDLANRASSYAMPGVIVDGQEIDAVHAAAREAVERARAGGGPTLLEMKTYRYRGHSRSDPGRYRPDGELEAWRRRDPIELFGSRLLGEGATTEADLARIREAVAVEIDEATNAAERAPYPTMAAAAGLVYVA
jgi:acetoin:2,6-dichlorophenolindophenol oxidoreductase subunit alpha